VWLLYWPIVLYYCLLFRALCISISAFSGVRVRTFVTWRWLWPMSLWPLYVTCDTFKQSNLSAWSLLSWHPTHTHLWVRLLFFQSCLFCTVTVTPSDSDLFTPSDSDFGDRSASLQRFQLSHMTPSRQSRVRFWTFVPRGACAPGSRRTKSLETAATRVVTGISHLIVLFCERYWLAGVWSFILRVMTYVVSYELFWN